MELPVEIKATDVFGILTDLFDSNTWEPGKTEKAIADGVSIRYETASKPLIASIESQAVLQITLIIGQNVVLPTVLGVLSSYLYDKLKEHNMKRFKIGAASLSINEREIYQAIMKEFPKQDDTKT